MSAPDPTWRFFGALLMGVGGTMMALCGACSALCLIVVVPATFSLVTGVLSGRSSDPYAAMFIQSFVFLGVIPILAGWGVYLLGRRLGRRAEVVKTEPGQPPSPPGGEPS